MWLSVVFGTEFAYGDGSLPHFALAEGFEFLFELFAIIGLGVAVNRYLGFVAGL